jgi:hypothetical protein
MGSSQLLVKRSDRIIAVFNVQAIAYGGRFVIASSGHLVRSPFGRVLLFETLRKHHRALRGRFAMQKLRREPLVYRTRD